MSGRDFWVIVVAASVGAVTSCGGVSKVGDLNDDDGVDWSTGGTGAAQPTGQGGSGAAAPGDAAQGGNDIDIEPSTGGTGARGGSAGSIGRAGMGAHSGSPGRNGAGGTAPMGGAGGTAPMGGAGGIGGTAGIGIGGDGGEPDCAPSSYTELAGWRCEDTESYAQGRNYERVEGATSLDQCLDACDAREDCSAVSDFLMTFTFFACYLGSSSCDMLSKPVSAEEDGGRTHQKICTDDGACHFEAIPDNYGCGSEEQWGVGSQVQGATSIDDCKDACLASPTCQSVVDYFYLEQVEGCYLNTSTCDAPVKNWQDGRLYVKDCR